MMTHPKGTLSVTVGERDYTLFLGFSVIADLQARHGQDVLERLQPPDGASRNWVPDMRVVVDVVLCSLQRFHEDEADKWLADDILSNNGDILGDLMEAAFPSAPAGQPSGNGRKPKKAA